MVSEKDRFAGLAVPVVYAYEAYIGSLPAGGYRLRVIHESSDRQDRVFDGFVTVHWRQYDWRDHRHVWRRAAFVCADPGCETTTALRPGRQRRIEAVEGPEGTVRDRGLLARYGQFGRRRYFQHPKRPEAGQCCKEMYVCPGTRPARIRFAMDTEWDISYSGPDSMTRSFDGGPLLKHPMYSLAEKQDIMD